MQLQQPTKEKKLTKWTVEQSSQLTIGHLGKKLLMPQAGILGKNGKVPITDSWKIMEMEFWVILGKRPHVRLSFTKNGKREKDTVYLTTQAITFGTKVYFLCSCGRRCLKLFSRNSCYGFGCRRCQNLGYEIHNWNRRGSWGALGLYFNRYEKLGLMDKLVRRISYRGRFTRRAAAVLKMAKKWTLPAAAGALVGYNHVESQKVLAN